MDDHNVELERVSQIIIFGGEQCEYKHKSITFGCTMKFSTFIPPTANSCFPVLYWLHDGDSSGDFLHMVLPQKAAVSHNMAIVVPDTFPSKLCKKPEAEKGSSADKDVNNSKLCKKPEGEKGKPDGENGISAYKDGVLESWKMYDYVVNELPSIINKHFKEIDGSRASISGFLTGGHAALMIYLQNSDKYKVIRCAPLTNPTLTDHQSLTKFLTKRLEWEKYDATCLVRSCKTSLSPIMIDQGTADAFLDEHRLLLQNFKQACRDARVMLTLNLRPGYVNDSFFVATFIDCHFNHHAKYIWKTECESLPTMNLHATRLGSNPPCLYMPAGNQYQEGSLRRPKKNDAEEREIEFKLVRKGWNFSEKRGYFDLINPFLEMVNAETVLFEHCGNEYCLQAMQATNHRNILSLGVVYENTSGVGNESAMFQYVEKYDSSVGCKASHFFNAKALLTPPSEAFQDMIRQIMEGLDHLHQRGFYHGNLSWSSVLYCRSNDVTTYKLTDFKKQGSEDVESEKMGDWNALGCMLKQVSNMLKTKANATPHYGSGLIDELAIFLTEFSDRTALQLLMKRALGFTLFWNRTRSYFFRIEVIKALKSTKFRAMVAKSKDVCQVPWNIGIMKQLLVIMNDFREENEFVLYQADERVDFVKLVCAAYTHESEILRKNGLDIDKIIQSVRMELFVVLRKFISLT